MPKQLMDFKSKGRVIMNTNANKIPCDILYYPKDTRFMENIREFQGCPTIAVTKKGRIFLGWYAGGTREPHMDNYNLLIYSDDNGKTWSEPVIIIPSSRKHFIHALDIQLWIFPDDKLHIMWVQNNTALETEQKPELKPDQPWIIVDGYQFYDFIHSEWECICDNPDADTLEFSEPRFIYEGFSRNKPLVLKSGRRLDFNYDQQTDRYGYCISDDDGISFKRYYGQKKFSTEFDEAMAYQLNDGRIRMLSRAKGGYIAQSYSSDDGESWSKATVTDIKNPYTRFYISRTPSGRILLVNNDNTDPQKRNNMTLYLSDDDGTTWKYKKLIDSRMDVSYPDVDFYNGKIYLTYDRERIGAKEILFSCFTEDNIIDKNKKIDIQIVSKP